jgi:hypothetical protein
VLGDQQLPDRFVEKLGGLVRYRQEQHPIGLLLFQDGAIEHELTESQL